MAVQTKTVRDRREPRFESLDEIVADAERLAEGGYRRAGNWSLGQVCQHLANVMVGSLDGFDFDLPWHVKLMVRPMKSRMMRRGFPSGVSLKGDVARAFLPAEDVTDEQGLNELREAVARLKTEPQRVPSPLLGRLTREQWEQFHCRHAELHLSFLHPR